MPSRRAPATGGGWWCSTAPTRWAGRPSKAMSSSRSTCPSSACIRCPPGTSPHPSEKPAARPGGGVRVHARARRLFTSSLTYLLLISHARRKDPARSAWRDPPYEYEHVKRPIDILYGSDEFRRSAEQG